MKTVIQIVAIDFIVLLLQPAHGAAQKLPDELLEAAKVNFTKAFKAEFGKRHQRRKLMSR